MPRKGYGFEIEKDINQNERSPRDVGAYPVAHIVNEGGSFQARENGHGNTQQKFERFQAGSPSTAPCICLLNEQ